MDHKQNNLAAWLFIAILVPLASLLLYSGFSKSRVLGYLAVIYNAIISFAVIAFSLNNHSYYLYCLQGILLSLFLFYVCARGTVKPSKASK